MPERNTRRPLQPWRVTLVVQEARGRSSIVLRGVALISVSRGRRRGPHWDDRPPEQLTLPGLEGPPEPPRARRRSR
jgi:hypothetical protein